MGAEKAAENAIQLVGSYADQRDGLSEARAALMRCLSHLRAADAPSDLLLTIKREGLAALDPRSNRRKEAAEAVRVAVTEWKREVESADPARP